MSEEETPKLFQPVRLGDFKLQHRVVMPPLTRLRAGPGEVASDLIAEYYGQRASPGGLIIAEATAVSKDGEAYNKMPSCFTKEQAAGWKKATDAVHRKGGVVLSQIWHGGRVSHSSFQEGGGPPRAPSAIAMCGEVFQKGGGKVPAEVPAAYETEEVAGVVQDFRRGAEMAKEAGFDGVELHGGKGFLIEQFLSASTNTRGDRYGGSAENRARFLFEVLDAVCEVFPASRVGVRLSPWNTFGDIGGSDEERHEQYSHVLERLERRPDKVAFVHLCERRIHGGTGDASDDLDDAVPGLLAASGYTGSVIAAGGFSRVSALAATGGPAAYADAVAFGRMFISNPDLPARLAANHRLNPYDRATFYGGDHRGYTDYPAMSV